MTFQPQTGSWAASSPLPPPQVARVIARKAPSAVLVEWSRVWNRIPCCANRARAGPTGLRAFSAEGIALDTCPHALVTIAPEDVSYRGYPRPTPRADANTKGFGLAPASCGNAQVPITTTAAFRRSTSRLVNKGRAIAMGIDR